MAADDDPTARWDQAPRPRQRRISDTERLEHLSATIVQAAKDGELCPFLPPSPNAPFWLFVPGEKRYTGKTLHEAIDNAILGRETPYGSEPR